MEGRLISTYQMMMIDWLEVGRSFVLMFWGASQRRRTSTCQISVLDYLEY